jgi:hypothetical protein
LSPPRPIENDKDSAMGSNRQTPMKRATGLSEYETESWTSKRQTPIVKYDLEVSIGNRDEKTLNQKVKRIIDRNYDAYLGRRELSPDPFKMRKNLVKK